MLIPPIRVLSAGVSLLTLAFSLPAVAANPDGTFDDPVIVRDVLAANEAMVAAANRLDLDSFFAAMLEADHAMIVQNGTIFETRAEARAAVERALYGVTGVERRFENPQVTVISPEVALLVSEGSVTATYQDGRQMSGRFAVSLVFVLRDGGWKLLHGHYSTPMARP